MKSIKESLVILLYEMELRKTNHLKFKLDYCINELYDCTGICALIDLLYKSNMLNFNESEDLRVYIHTAINKASLEDIVKYKLCQEESAFWFEPGTQHRVDYIKQLIKQCNEKDN